MVLVSTSSSGRVHPVENTLATLTLGLGLVCVLCLMLGLWDLGAWTGLAGALVAAYDEFIASTSSARRVILAGFVVCLVTLAVSMANGAVF